MPSSDNQSISASFRSNIVGSFGEVGLSWLRNLPTTITQIANRWSLDVQPPFPGLSYNYVAPAHLISGDPVILKLGVPNDELLSEIAALRLYDGRGIVRLLEADPESGALLLERLHLGEMLSQVEDDEAATSIAAGVMRQLWCPAPEQHNFRSVADLFAGLNRLRRRFDGGTGPLPELSVDRAERLFAELSSLDDPPVVLHGDLHHYNILSAQRQPWLAIDPKGFVGPAGYEVGPLLYNPFGLEQVPDLRSLLSRRVDQLADELDMDREVVLGWGGVAAVLSAWWSVEAGETRTPFTVTVAEMLASL